MIKTLFLSLCIIVGILGAGLLSINIYTGYNLAYQKGRVDIMAAICPSVVSVAVQQQKAKK